MNKLVIKFCMIKDSLINIVNNKINKINKEELRIQIEYKLIH